MLYCSINQENVIKNIFKIKLIKKKLKFKKNNVNSRNPGSIK